jgi:hypothetical protein
MISSGIFLLGGNCEPAIRHKAGKVRQQPEIAGEGLAPSSPRHCERSEAIHISTKEMDCFVAMLLAMTASVWDFGGFAAHHCYSSPKSHPS